MSSLDLSTMTDFAVVFALGMLAGVLALLAVEQIRERCAASSDDADPSLAQLTVQWEGPQA